jgi:hypothetical protein
MKGEPFEEQVALRLGRLLEFSEVRPGSFGVYVVGSDGGDAAPVVDPGVYVPHVGWRAVLCRFREVRWGLHGHPLW